MTDATQLLRAVEKFEGAMSTVYERLSDRFAADKEASTLFARLAFEEKGHRSQVEYVGRLIRPIRTTLGPLQIDEERLALEIRAVERITEMADQVELSAAVVQLVQIERGAGEEAWFTALANTSPEIAKVVHGLEAGSLRHREMLQDFAQRRGFIGPKSAAPAPPRPALRG
jgi:hypothetical protein